MFVIPTMVNHKSMILIVNNKYHSQSEIALLHIRALWVIVWAWQLNFRGSFVEQQKKLTAKTQIIQGDLVRKFAI